MQKKFILNKMGKKLVISIDLILPPIKLCEASNGKLSLLFLMQQRA